MIILLHSSKTMRVVQVPSLPLRAPYFLDKACQIDAYLKTLSSKELVKIMRISQTLAQKTHSLIASWTAESGQSLAIDSFIGDIYSGLQAQTLSSADRDYADQTLRILSGLYGIIRPQDGICPYRLEMAYKLPGFASPNLYNFWADLIAKTLPLDGPIVNVASDEYARAVLPFIDVSRVITPRFLTRNPKTGEPTFVVVHAKIARGAFARWLITSRLNDISKLKEFCDLGYHFEQKLSDSQNPTYVCDIFGGKGLSIRLK